MSLPHLAFNRGELAVDKKHNFHQVDVLSRKAMLHNLVTDKFLGTILTFVSAIVEEWDKQDMTKLAVYVNNKLRFRSFVLDLAVGCTESKNTRKSTSFYTPTLFGPFPESFNARLICLLGK